MNQLGNPDHCLYVSEQFGPTLQGEGLTAGMPSYFLRLTACNLSCGRKNTSHQYDGTMLEDATWVCDTIEVFRNGVKKTTQQIVDGFDKAFIADMKYQRAHLVITGGEPLLQQKSIVNFIVVLTSLCEGNFPFVEVETNGTIMPEHEMMQFVSLWNVSPKLSNSGMEHSKRVFPNVIMQLNALNSCFKFVVERKRDLMELEVEYLENIDHDKVMLMPAASEKTALENLSEWVAKHCIERRWKFSGRLQIQIWNKKTGV